LWPNNAVKDFLAIAVTMDKTKAWKIFLDGSYTSIPVKEVDNY
jgi:hypothetical protein